MKNSSKNNYSGNNRIKHKENSDNNFYPKNTNSSKKNNRLHVLAYHQRKKICLKKYIR